MNDVPAEEYVWQALHLVDTAQTLYATKHPEQFREMNPLLGAHPSTEAVLVWSVGFAVLHYAILRELQARGINPSRFERVTIAVKGAGVAINFTMGARP